jgi:TRAP-type C4-dicarboxylate transport system permease small subunit
MLFVPLGGVLLLLAALESFWRALAGAAPAGAPATVVEEDG